MSAEDTMVTCQYLRQYFLQQWKENKKERTLTEDIFYIFSGVSKSVGNPVQVLKEMGIIFFGDAIAINFSIFQTQIICCKKKALSMLEKEGWVDVSKKYTEKLGTLIGMNEVKNWITFSYPEPSNFSEFLKDKNQLMATKEKFGLDKVPEFLLIGPGMRLDDVLVEPHFPLVPIQYEKQIISYDIASFPPINTKPRPEYKITAVKQININYKKV